MRYPLFKVAIETSSALAEIKEVFESGYVNEGIQVTKFQEGIKKNLGVNHLTLMNSCTSALTVAYLLAGVRPGTEVITTAMTCVATNTPIVNLGADIVWCDINPETGNIKPEDIEPLITSNTKAIAYVNWAGNPADIEAIWEIGKRHKIKVIQDAAHSYGAKWNGKSIAHYADFTCFSFQAIKHLSAADGGAIVCSNPDDHKLAQKLKWFGYDREASKDEKGEWKGQRWDADIVKGEVGYKFNMNNVSAAIGISGLPKIDLILNAHRRNAALFNREFADFKLIKPLKIPTQAISSFWVYTMLLDTKNSLDRDNVIQDLNSKGIGAGLIHLPNDNYSAFSKSKKNLPGLRDFEMRQISLPCGWWLSEANILEIAKETKETIKKFMKN